MKKLSICIACIAIVLSSCNSNENNQTTLPDGSLKPINLTVQIDQINTKDKTSSAHSFDNEITTNTLKEIGVHVCKHGKFGTEYISGSHNTKWIKNTNQWTTSKSIYLGSDKANIHAYYPHVDNATDLSKIKIKIGDIDYLFGKGTTNDGSNDFANNQATNVTIQMKHAMAQIVWNFSKSADYNGAATVQAIQVGNIDQNGEMNILNGNITIPNSPSIYNFSSDKLNFNIEGTVSRNLMVFPAAYQANSLYMTFVISGKTMTKTLDTTKWERGKKYNYNVKVNATGITIENVVVEEWDISTTETNFEIN